MAESILDNIVQESSNKYIIKLPSNTKRISCTIPSHDDLESIMSTVSTGFGVANSLDITPCSENVFHQPLYKENYLGEFKTEEEQRLARHNLGLYDEKDVVGMSLITTDDPLQKASELSELEQKVIMLGGAPFSPQTVAKTVMVKQENRSYENLLSVIDSNLTILDDLTTTLSKLSDKSYYGSQIKTVGDVSSFLQGYTNELTLKSVIDKALDTTLKFESKGTIETTWQQI